MDFRLLSTEWTGPSLTRIQLRSNIERALVSQQPRANFWLLHSLGEVHYNGLPFVLTVNRSWSLINQDPTCQFSQNWFLSLAECAFGPCQLASLLTSNKLCLMQRSLEAQCSCQSSCNTSYHSMSPFMTDHPHQLHYSLLTSNKLRLMQRSLEAQCSCQSSCNTSHHRMSPFMTDHPHQLHHCTSLQHIIIASRISPIVCITEHCQFIRPLNWTMHLIIVYDHCIIAFHHCIFTASHDCIAWLHRRTALHHTSHHCISTLHRIAPLHHCIASLKLIDVHHIIALNNTVLWDSSLHNHCIASLHCITA